MEAHLSHTPAYTYSLRMPHDVTLITPLLSKNYTWFDSPLQRYVGSLKHFCYPPINPIPPLVGAYWWFDEISHPSADAHKFDSNSKIRMNHTSIIKGHERDSGWTSLRWGMVVCFICAHPISLSKTRFGYGSPRNKTGLGGPKADNILMGS